MNHEVVMQRKAKELRRAVFSRTPLAVYVKPNVVVCDQYDIPAHTTNDCRGVYGNGCEEFNYCWSLYYQLYTKRVTGLITQEVFDKATQTMVLDM